MKRLALSVLFAAILCVPALAQQAVPLSQAELDKYLTDYPAAAAFLENQGQTAQPDALAETRMTKEFEDFLSKRGWSAPRFLYVTQQVSSGFVALQMAEQGPRIQSEFEQTRAEIQKSPDLTPDQKKQLLAQMEQGMAQTKAMGDASKLAPGEMALIKANKARIYKTFAVD